MLHWAKSFSVIAIASGLIGLGALAPAFSGAALLVATVFAALTALSLITLALGRRRDGTYSSERALTLLGLAVAAVLFAQVALKQGWTLGDVERVVGRGWVLVAVERG